MTPTTPAQLYLPDARLVALVGAGGKTSLMAAMAAHARAAGQTVISTTTTKILPPSANSFEISLAGQDGNVLFWDGNASALGKVRDQLFGKGHLTLVRGWDQSRQKLIGLAPEQVDLLAAAGMADRIFVEADGARNKPLKAPADHEPVIPDTSELIIAIIGAEAIGAPLDESRVFRNERLAALCQSQPGQTVDAQILACLATHPQGLFKNSPPACRRILFVNKMERAIARGGEILHQAHVQAGILHNNELPGDPLWFMGSIIHGWIAPVDSGMDSIRGVI